MSFLPDWAEPVLEYMLRVGLKGTLQTVETFTTLAVTYLAIVWTMSASIRVVERRLALPEDAR